MYSHSISNASSFSATFSESSENDNQRLTLPDQISDTEWTPGPDMNWVTS